MANQGIRGTETAGRAALQGMCLLPDIRTGLTCLRQWMAQGFNEEALDVADPQILSRLAEEVDAMSVEEAKTFLASDELEYELEKELEKPQHLGIDSGTQSLSLE